jgi:hypothetical protein
LELHTRARQVAGPTDMTDHGILIHRLTITSNRFEVAGTVRTPVKELGIDEVTRIGRAIATNATIENHVARTARAVVLQRGKAGASRSGITRENAGLLAAIPDNAGTGSSRTRSGPGDRCRAPIAR